MVWMLIFLHRFLYDSSLVDGSHRSVMQNTVLFMCSSSLLRASSSPPGNCSSPRAAASWPRSSSVGTPYFFSWFSEQGVVTSFDGKRYISMNHWLSFKIWTFKWTGFSVYFCEKSSVVCSTFHIFHGGSRDWPLRGAKSLYYCLHTVISKGSLPIVFLNYPIKTWQIA